MRRNLSVGIFFGSDFLCHSKQLRENRLFLFVYQSAGKYASHASHNYAFAACFCARFCEYAAIMRIICAVVVISGWEERKTERHPVKIPSLGIFTACFGVAEACQERENIADVMAISNFVFVKIFYLAIVLKGVFFANGLA